MQISKRFQFDFAIIGAGIAGACSAYFLKKLGKRVVVIDRDRIASGGSGAAGAFLSPKICSNSAYTAFINESFEFSIKFYQDNFREFLDAKGLLRLLKNQDDIKKCHQKEDSLPEKFHYLNKEEQKYLKQSACEFGGYFFEDGAVIESTGVIEALLKDIDVIEALHVEVLNYANNCYYIGDIEAKNVILCAGNSEDFTQIKYLGLKNIYGHRVDVRTQTKLPFHLHKSCSISASHDGCVHIGATHIPNYRYSKDKNFDKELNDMLALAKSYVDFEDFRVQKVHFGVRNSTRDFYPAIGRVIDVEATIKKFPYIKKGSKVPKEIYICYPNLYVMAGLGARGFVLAPKLADTLVKSICEGLKIGKNLETERLFLKYVQAV